MKEIIREYKIINKNVRNAYESKNQKAMDYVFQKKINPLI